MLHLNFKKELTKKNILEEIRNQYLVYEYYLQEPIKEGKRYISPLREDKHPSLTFKFFPYTNSWVWRDWGDGSQIKALGIFDFVMKFYNCNFVDAMIRLNEDLGLGLSSLSSPSKSIKRFSGYSMPEHKRKLKKRSKINIQFREFTEENITYWKQFGVTIETLNKFNVKVVKRLWVNDKIIKSNVNGGNVFAYIINNRVKIYHPDSYLKFLGNVQLSDISGYEQLIDKGDVLIITKSHKDVMTLYEMGYNAISPQGESMLINNEVMIDLKERFNIIYLLYDNDFPGKEASEKLLNKYPFLIQIYIPETTSCKDISELSHDNGIEKANVILKNILW